MRAVRGMVVGGILLSLLSGVAHARNKAIVFGGVCDEGKSGNTFRDTFASLGKALARNGWEVDSLYDGDTARCTLPPTDTQCQRTPLPRDCCPAGASPEAWAVQPIADALHTAPQAVPRASKGNLVSALDRALDLGENDQLLVVIDTHGWGEAKKGSGPWQHSVCMHSDEPPGWVLVNIDDAEITARLAKLREKKVKLAFTDDSCYGGGSVPALSKYGCVLSATSSQLVNTSVTRSSTVTSSKGSVYQEASTNVDKNLIELLNLPAKDLRDQTLGSDRLTLEDLYLRVLARSRLSANLPEFGGFLTEVETDDALNHWWQALEIESYNRSALSPLSNCSECSQKITPDPLEDYVTRLLGSLDEAEGLRLLDKIYPTPAHRSMYGNDQVLAPAELRAKVRGLPQAWKSYRHKFEDLSRKETATLEKISQLHFPVHFDFNEFPAGTREAFLKAVSSATAQGLVVAFPMKDHALWIGDPATLPDGRFFESSLANSIRHLAARMAADGFSPAQRPDFVARLKAEIQGAETRAWSTLAEGEKKKMEALFQDLKSVQWDQQNLTANMPDEVRNYLVQSRFYSYLSYRRSKAGADDPRRKECEGFTLKNLSP